MMRNRKHRAVALAAVGAFTYGVAMIAAAQQPPEQQQQPPPPQGGGGGGGGGRGGGFGGGRQAPFMGGTISAIDQNTGRLTVQSPFGGGQGQTIQLTNTTQLVAQTTIEVSDLKVGDTIRVQGVPTGITVNSISAGDPPDFLFGGAGGPGGGPGRGGAGGGAFGGAGQGGGQVGRRGAGGGGGADATAAATGRVTSVNPLTIALGGGGASLTLQVAPGARVTKIAAVGFDALKVGDRVMASGQAGADGTFTATGLGINLEMGPGFGGGGFGGGFGGPGRPGGRPGGGPGGPGGAPPPPRQP